MAAFRRGKAGVSQENTAAMRTFWRFLGRATAVLCVLCLFAIFGGVLVNAWQAWQNRGWKDAIAASVSAQATAAKQLIASGGAQGTSGGSAPPLTAEEKLSLEHGLADTQERLIREIRAYDTDERAVLDRLITLVGLYSAVLGLTAFFSLRFAREDARADLTGFKSVAQNDLTSFKTGAQTELNNFKTTIQSDLDNFRTTTQTALNNFKTTTQGDLTSFKTGTQTDLTTYKSATTGDLDTFKNKTEAAMTGMRLAVEEFQKKIWSELPEMRNLKDGLRDLLLDLERTIPAETNWNAARPYENLDESQRQKILISEATVGALQVFVSSESSVNRETLARFFRALARFYLGRFRIEKQTTDAERADIYARKSQDMEPESADGYRLRGALYLAKYRILKKDTSAPDSAQKSEKLETCLGEAESFLGGAMKRDPNDAGAAYNMALVHLYRDQLDRAIDLSHETIGKQDSFSHLHVRKYLPSIYLNLGCFLAKKADLEKDPQAQEKLREEAVKAVEEVYAYFKDKKISLGIQALQDGIQREKKDTGDFRNLTAAQLARLDAVLAA